MSDTKGDDVLTTAQVKEKYGISRTTLWRLGKQGILKPIEEDTLLVHPHENRYYLADIERAAQIIAERRKAKAND